MRKRVVRTPDFADTIAKAGGDSTEFALAAGLERTTIHALINPAPHPERKGSMQRTTAWKIAGAYAERTHISPEDAYAELRMEDER
jgi:hypothetical protein